MSAGWWHNDKLEYRFYHHTRLLKFDDIKELQSILDKTTILVCHNAKFELMWIKAVGLKYDGYVADTMIREYILACGQKLSVSLEESCKRHNLTHKKSDLVDDYIKQGIGFDVIDPAIVEEYGLGDVQSTLELYHNQVTRLEQRKHLWPTVKLMEEFCVCLADIETNGIKIDIAELDRLEEAYKREQLALEADLEKMLFELMGDTPINLDSPEDLSKVIYSREVNDKHLWAQIFNIGSELRGSVRKSKRRRHLPTAAFIEYVTKYTDVVRKTQAVQCEACRGKGHFYRTKKDGNDFKRPTNCPLCTGSGVVYEPLKQIAGLRISPTNVYDTVEHGFVTDKDSLQKYIETGDPKSIRVRFLTAYRRRSQIDTYLNTFINGIRNGLKDNYILHPKFNQCVTATGRLSSSGPNFQNQPRGNTFPVRGSVISRFLGGSVLSGDFKQLEFRIAGALSGDEEIHKDVAEGKDVHSETAKWTKLSRTDSKPYTFAPIYGATDKGKAEHIAAYFIYFKKRYHQHYEWIAKIQNEILQNGGFFQLPSGREYFFPNTIRYSNGTISNSTIIANYPVQGFATADVAIMATIAVWRLFLEHKLKSLVMLQVHDDVTCDVYPGEEEIAAKLLKKGMESVKEDCKKRYNYDLTMPIEVEIKIGPNWLEQKEIEVD